MIKFIEDDWTGENIDLSEPFYFVNGEITSKDNLTEENITVYYDNSGNEYDERDVNEFNNVEELIDYLENEIEKFEDMRDYLFKENHIVSSKKYEKYAEDYRKILNKFKIEGGVE